MFMEEAGILCCVDTEFEILVESSGNIMYCKFPMCL